MSSMIATAKSQLPQPSGQERPADYADRIGQIFSKVAFPTKRREYGQFFTPITVADFMARLFTLTGSRLRILDPGAGTGILACAVCESLAASGAIREIEVDVYESDLQLVEYLERSLSYLQSWLGDRNIKVRFTVRQEDFILANAEALSENGSLFVPLPRGGYDVVIANPPYFKLPKSDPRAQAVNIIVSGQPNMYAAFMAVSAALLKNGGELVCITPRSFTAGPYFRLFREKFFGRMLPQAVHLFDSRTEAFGRDEVLQENLILKARRVEGWTEKMTDSSVEISSSRTDQDLSERKARIVPVRNVLNWTDKDKVLRLLLADTDDAVARLMNQWTGSLHRYGLEISTGPVVPFRATEFIRPTGDVPQTHAPLLWMQNVSAMKSEWPVTTRNKAQYILVNPESDYLLVKNANYVLLRRFSAKEAARRLVAAPFLTSNFSAAPLIGLENHLNYIHRPKGNLLVEEAYGLAAFLNSALADCYFRTFNGNTQVSATELRAMPLPPLPLIVELGKQVLSTDLGLQAIDRLVNELFQS